MICAYDVESTGLNCYQGARMFAYCIGYANGKVDVYRKEDKDYRPVLKQFFADTTIKKVFHNAKFDLTMTEFEGVHIPKETVIHDTMIMSQMLRNIAPSHSMEFLAWELSGWPRSGDQEIKKMGNAYGGYHKIPKEKMHAYQIADGQRTMMMYKTFFPDIYSNPRLFEDYLNEMELIKTTIKMEKTGIKVDIPKCLEMISWMDSELDLIQNEVYELFGEYINLNSDHQIKRILYGILDLPILKKTKKTKMPAVDKDVLAQLRLQHTHPVLDLITKQRSYTKGMANLKSYIELTNKFGVLHPTINTNGAQKTGRESSENPNLQNVSKRQALLNPFPVPARKCFVAPDDCVLYLVDYSGIEMRLIVEFAQELELLEAINQNKDIHAMAAIVLFAEKYVSNPTKILRSAAKNTNFAIPYGASNKKCAQTLGLSLDLAIPRIKEYKNRWPGVGYFTKNLGKQIKDNGYVITAFGRKLYAPRNKPYMGANYIIQGTAAGILKRAQNKVSRYLRDCWNDEIKLVMPIHDELIIQYPKKLLKYRNSILPEISGLMTDMPEINVKLNVEWRITKNNWDNTKDVKIKQ